MAFKLDDLVIDRIQYGIAEATNGDLLYTLTQLQDASISITAESKDATDATGTLIKRFYTGKSGEFTATNALVNLNIIGAMSGEGVTNEDVAGTGKIQMPKIIRVQAGSTTKLSSYVNGTVKVYALGTNGALGAGLVQGDAQNAGEYTLTAYEPGTQRVVTSLTSNEVYDGELKVPTETTGGEQYYIIKYDRVVSDSKGAKVVNHADKFPSTVRLTLKALAVDPCTVDTLRSCYIVLPSFQVSPEVTITLDTEGGIDYAGQLQVDYCSTDKSLYYVYMAEDDKEED